MCAQSCPTLCDPRTLALQAPLSMGFSRQVHWSGLPFPTPGVLFNPGVELESFLSSALAGGFFSTVCLESPTFVPWGALITETCSRASVLARLRSQNSLGQKWFLLYQESHTCFSFSGDTLPYLITSPRFRMMLAFKFHPQISESPHQNPGPKRLDLIIFFPKKVKIWIFMLKLFKIVKTRFRLQVTSL